MDLPGAPPTSAAAAPAQRWATRPGPAQVVAVLVAHLLLLLLLWRGQAQPSAPTPTTAPTAWVQARVLPPAAPPGGGVALQGQAAPADPAGAGAAGGRAGLVDAPPMPAHHGALRPVHPQSPPSPPLQPPQPRQQQRLLPPAERPPGAPASVTQPTPGPSPSHGPTDGLPPGQADVLPASAWPDDPRAERAAQPLPAAPAVAGTEILTTGQAMVSWADQATDPADLSTPPPLYPVRWPAGRRVAYRGLQGGRPVQAELDWQPGPPGGGPYHLALRLWPAGAAPQGAGQPPAAPPPLQLQQHSQGQLSPHGLVPERLLDRRRSRGARAVNLQWPSPGAHEAGRLSFSASTARWPVWPGTQDRLSWLLQLAAVADAAAQGAASIPLPAAPGASAPATGARAAAPASSPAAAVPAQPLSEVELLVADASGGIGRWRLVLQGEAAAPWPGGPRRLQHWRHSPASADGLQVDVWLDPAQGHWPAGWRYTLLRTGAQLLLWQASPDAP